MGYETELFVKQPVDENLICHICQDVLEKPATVCAMGHMFCEECISSWEQTRSGCPECREGIISKILCRPVQNMIMDLKVSCPEIADFEVKETSKDDDEEEAEERDPKRARKEGDENGGASKQKSISARTCEWEGTLSDYLERHRLHECRYRKVQCELGCNEMIRCCDLESHRTSQCSHRLINCTLCNEEMKQLDLAHHDQKLCPERSTNCIFCGERMLRKLLGNRPTTPSRKFDVDDLPKGLSSFADQYSGHYKTCPKIRVHCDFHEHGCTRTIKREDLEEHHAKFARVHARLVNQEIKSIRESQHWSKKEIYWRIPEDVLEEALDDPVSLFVEESQRVKVGGYQAFLRLTIDEGVVYAKACVDRPPFAPSIDGLEIEVENNDDQSSASAYLSMDDKQEMAKDAVNSRTWSAGGALRYSSSDTEEERDTTAYDLETLSSNGDIVLRAEFRLKEPTSVMVDCHRH